MHIEMALLALVSLSRRDCSQHADMELSRYKFCSNEDSSNIVYPLMGGGQGTELPAP